MSNEHSEHDRPIFLHGMWRCGSTYVWSRFRAAENTYCYYEPLHHGLSRLTADKLVTYAPEVFEAHSHPVLVKPHFAEFEPLLSNQGVQAFQKRFAYKRYLLQEGDKDDALKKYVESLVTFAASRNKMPVLGFNRTGLRMAWLRKEFSPCNIHIDRDPRDVRASYMRQMEQGNYTFFAAWLRIAEENAAHPVFAPLVDSLPIRKAVQKLVTKPKSFYRKALDEMEPAMTYFPVFYMWVASALHALSYCDLVFDMEHAAEKGYAASRSDMIRAACGLDVNFDDVRTNRAGSEERNPELEAIEQQVLGIFPIKAFSAFYNRDSVYVRLPELSRRKAGLLKALL